MMDDLIVILKGHYRSFSHTHKSWKKSLTGCNHKMYIHTWDTVDATSSTWHNSNKAINELTKENIALLKSYDEGCVIEAQSWTPAERRENLRNNAPFKSLLYYWHGIHSCISRIKKESKYVVISRPDVWVNIDFKNVVCEEGEILIGFSYSVNSRLPYAVTDIVYLFNYSDLDKFKTIPQTLYDWKNDASIYKIQEDPITDFFNKNWKKVTPKWFLYDNHFKIVRIPCSKMAFLLCGQHNGYKQYKRNIQRYIYNTFESMGYEVDTFVCTSESEDRGELLRDYAPKCHMVTEEPDKIEIIKMLIKYISDTGENYNMVCLTRFDIYFLGDIKIHSDKLNIFSKVLGPKGEELVDDNLYVFPARMLRELLDAMIANELEKRFQINYIKNELKRVEELTSFRLRFFNDVNLTLTKYLFTDNVKYHSKYKSVEIIINKSDVYLKKVKEGKHLFSWFGYELAAGTYDLTFDVLSDKDIDFPFVKTHFPTVYYKAPYIHANVPLSVNLRIKIEKTYTLLAFIFDDYEGCATIQFKNVSYKPVKDI